MPLSAFQRLSDRILTRLGEDAVLRASTDCRVNIERNVEVMGNEGQMAYLRTVATVQKSLAARKGDTLTLVDADGQPIPGESYVIDSPAFEDNGFTARYVLRSA